MRSLLRQIYGPQKGDQAYNRLKTAIDTASTKSPNGASYYTAEDIFLITYGDSLQSPEERPLQTFRRFTHRYLKGVFSTIHFLPFFPYSSDDGFAVTDFFSINPALGTWSDVQDFRSDFGLMFDYVLNHISAQSPWFRQYLDEKEGFGHLAIEVDPSTDLSQVTRPRSLPLLTPFTKRSGEAVHLWTTFSADQVDLNYASIDVFEKMINVLLFYVAQGATALRLDAVAYLWKTVGTACIHLPQTHDMIRLFRQVLDQVAPEVMLVTETNVPHAENISYFGDGYNEAQMVYNFTLPPLLLYTFMQGDAGALTAWAKGLVTPSDKTTFFNFTASHDGIGVRPLEGILSANEVDRLIEMVKQNGGLVSTKQNPNGSQSPYELNISYIDALRNPNKPGDTRHIQRFLATQAILYSLPGVPATYIHSLLGSRNWSEGVRKTGQARSINREKLNLDQVEAQLADRQSFRANIFFPYLELVKTRKRQPAFHPNSAFEVMSLDPRMFAFVRSCPAQTIYALTNISEDPLPVSLASREVPPKARDLISGQMIATDAFEMKPYQVCWLEVENHSNTQEIDSR